MTRLRRSGANAPNWLALVLLLATGVGIGAVPARAAELAAAAGPTSIATQQSPVNLAPVQSGIYVPGAAQDGKILDNLTGTFGAVPSIIPWYQPWGLTNGWYQPRLDSDALRRISAAGATPLITWEAWGAVNGVDPSHVANITGGAFDGYIDSWASGLKAYGKPVFLRLFHEMNNPAYPWAVGQNGNTAADLKAAWRYVYERFQRDGATNVVWVWCPNTENPAVPFASVYPGSDVVDWFGVDGYNGGTLLDWGGWRTPQQIFGRSFESFAALDAAKPVMIAETSTVGQGGSRAEWIDQLYRNLPMTHPSLKAIIWFDADLSGRGQADWRIETSASAMAAYRAATAARSAP